MSCWLDGTLIRAFRVERLPESLSKAEWLALRLPRLAVPHAGRP